MHGKEAEMPDKSHTNDRGQSADSTPVGAEGPRLPVGLVAMLYLVVCLAPLALAMTRSVAPAATWEIAAAGLGLVGLAAMAVQFVTSGRFQLISGRLGIDRDPEALL